MRGIEPHHRRAEYSSGPVRAADSAVAGQAGLDRGDESTEGEGEWQWQWWWEWEWEHE